MSGTRKEVKVKGSSSMSFASSSSCQLYFCFGERFTFMDTFEEVRVITD